MTATSTAVFWYNVCADYSANSFWFYKSKLLCANVIYVNELKQKKVIQLATYSPSPSNCTKIRIPKELDWIQHHIHTYTNIQAYLCIYKNFCNHSNKQQLQNELNYFIFQVFFSLLFSKPKKKTETKRKNWKFPKWYSF